MRTLSGQARKPLRTAVEIAEMPPRGEELPPLKIGNEWDLL